MKKIVLSFFVVISAVLCFACNKDTKITTLATPSNLEVENQYITFNEVENASYYLVYYDGNTFNLSPSNTGEIVFDASRILTETKTYEIKVKAIGEGKYKDSLYTSTVEYERTQSYGIPILKLNDKALTWGVIEDATNYTVRVSFPNNTKGYYTYGTNSFDITPLLKDVGSYVFQVKVGEVDDVTEYSGEITYAYSKQLEAPKDLSLRYNTQEQELYLYFIKDIATEEYLLTVNNQRFTLATTNINEYCEKVTYDNLTRIKLLSFLKSKDNSWGNVNDFVVTIQSTAKTNQRYYDSAISNKVSYTIKKANSWTTASITEENNLATLNWQNVVGASSYAIYKDFVFFCRVDADTNSMSFLKTDITNSIFNVQVEGVQHVNDSNMSNSVYLGTLQTSGSLNMSVNSSIISWNQIGESTDDPKYMLEIYNDQHYNKYIFNKSVSSFDLSSNYDYGNYTAKLTAFIPGMSPVIVTKLVDYKLKLSKPLNASIGSGTNRYLLSFDIVDNAMGYIVKLNSNIINNVFTNTSIDLTNHLLVSGTYSVQVKAIPNPAYNIDDSDWTSVGNIVHTIKIQAPAPKVEKENNKFILKFDEIENADKYMILINYESLYPDGAEYQADGYDITSYLTSAQRYTILVKALVNQGNRNYTDSDYSSISYARYIQLDTINMEDMTLQENLGRYYINFETKTHAAYYEIQIVNLMTEINNKIVVYSLPYDITNYMRDKGTYKIYVTAIAKNDNNYLYSSSQRSGNPYTYNKDKQTLNHVTGIEIEEKSPDTMNLSCSWVAVENADLYNVKISYIPERPNGESSAMIADIKIAPNSVNIGAYLSREGKYTISIKAMSNAKNDANEYFYNDSEYSTFVYNHIMTVSSDFRRNTIFFGGNTRTHYIESYQQFEDVVNYYLLNNNISYEDASTDEIYRLKIMLGQDINSLMVQENEDYIDDGKTVCQKLDFLISKAILEYQENYSVQLYNFKVVQINNGITYYVFNFESQLNNDKIATISAENTIKSFGQKEYLVNEKYRRLENYVFAGEKLSKLNVTNTEQLFTAVQMGKTPVFVGNCIVAQTVYNSCKDILRSICNNEMTDYEKVEAIYDWLINNVEFNYAFNTLAQTKQFVSDYTDATNTTRMGDCMYEYLEGVFYDEDNRSATSNGYAKAFVLMCKLEGIDAIKVNGKKDGLDYYWNKVYVNPNPSSIDSVSAWYAIDIVGSYNTTVINSTDYQLPTHKYFMVEDIDLYTIDYQYRNVVCSNHYNYSENKAFKYKKQFEFEGGTIIKEYSATGMFSYSAQVPGGVGLTPTTIETIKNLTTEETVTGECDSVEKYVKVILKYMLIELANGGNLALNIKIEGVDPITIANNITSNYYASVLSELSQNTTPSIVAKKNGDSVLIAMIKLPTNT